MKFKRSLICWALLFLAACGSSDPSSSTQVKQPGDYQQTINVEGAVRSYILHVPANYDGSTALPLVYVLHGHGGTAEGMVKITGMSDKADQNGFFVAYLQGTIGTDGKPGWNDGITPADGNTADDVEFVRELTQDLAGQVNLDTKRVYATGHSNGAAMTNRLGAEIPDVLAGIAVVSGAIGNSEDGGSTYFMIPPAQGPIAVTIIHGMQDTAVLYYGGQGNNPDQYMKPVSADVDFWTQANGCTGVPTQTQLAANVTSDDNATCVDGTEVELYSITDGVHEWPSAETHTHFSATDAIWDFFSRHSKKD